jgi:hypothetical protein
MDRPAATAASERDALLATKLYAPHPPSGFPARPQLLDELEQGVPRGLVLVCPGRVRQDGVACPAVRPDRLAKLDAKP